MIVINESVSLTYSRRTISARWNGRRRRRNMSGLVFHA